MRDPSPPALSASCPQSSGSGVTDPHLLPLAPEAMPLPTRPRRARQQRRGSGAVMPAFQCLAFQSVVTEPGLTTPRRFPETPLAPGKGPAVPATISPQTLLWLREAGGRWLPSCRHPRRRDLGRPSAPASGRFLAFRSVPDLSSPGTSRRRLEEASSSGQQQRPPRSLSSRRRSALSSAGVSWSHQPFHSSQQRKHVTAPAKTLSVTHLWPIRGGSPVPAHPGRCSPHSGGVAARPLGFPTIVRVSSARLNKIRSKGC